MGSASSCNPVETDCSIVQSGAGKHDHGTKSIRTTAHRKQEKVNADGSRDERRTSVRQQRLVDCRKKAAMESTTEKRVDQVRKLRNGKTAESRRSQHRKFHIWTELDCQVGKT